MAIVAPGVVPLSGIANQSSAKLAAVPRVARPGVVACHAAQDATERMSRAVGETEEGSTGMSAYPDDMTLEPVTG
jgi:hypothetical protein